MKVLFSLLLLASASAQISPDSYSSLHWRSIGPYRAGRITSVAGVLSQPNVYYVGTPGGGVWKTTDAGQVWKPIFDKVPVASIGAVAVAESNPDVVYVGTGEQTQGNGVYRSNDAGATWTNIGLPATYSISAIAIDPKNPDVVLVASAGSPLISDAQPGIFKTTNGGRDWKQTLFKDNDTAVMDMNMAAGNPKVMYASLLHRQILPPGTPPQPNARRQQDAFLYRSSDEGSTWQKVAGKGLPTEPMGRVGIVAAPGAHNHTVFAIAAQGFYRSDDQGESWQQSTKDPRIVGNGYFSRIFVDPTDANSIYVAQTSMYHSADGGKTFTAVFGAPSGDDFHSIWINPVAPQYMLLGVDQGAIVSVDHGATWSSWYNQPTGQFYHVITDDRFPYYVYAAQQDSGTAAVASRSDFGEITDRDWAPTGGFEFSFIAPDPINTNLVYIGGWYGSILRFDRTTGQVNPVFVKTPRYRTAGMAPVAFSPQNKKTLYVGSQYLMRSDDAGASWNEISSDLTKVDPPPADPADRARNNNATISTMALSTAQENLIWVGTSNGLIHVMRDGKTWQNVTPAGLPPRSFINELEASPHDPATGYAVINAFRDPKPYLYRTHDFGKSWQPITASIAPTFIARVVREDPVRKGLLYAGTENAAYISFDDGDHWQSLQLDLPTTPVRDMKVHGDDLVIATFGRSLYILDDLAPLRQLNDSVTKDAAFLFTPQKALRVRWDNSQDTPYPVETPAGENPPDGAILDYYLPSALSASDASTMKLQIFDAQHSLVREYTTTPADYDRSPKNVPDYWFEEPAALTNKPGLNRFVWDLRYPAYKKLRYSYFGQSLDYIEYTLADHTIPGKTPHEMPQGPLAVPGDYTVEFAVAGKKFTQPLTIGLDPRVHLSAANLQAQLDVERNIAAQMATTFAAYNDLRSLKSLIDERKKSLPNSTAAPASDSSAAATASTDPISALDAQVTRLRDGSAHEPGFGPINRELDRLIGMIGEGDGRPASALVIAVQQSCDELSKRVAAWKELAGSPGSLLTAANIYLHDHHLDPLPRLGDIPPAPACTTGLH